MNGEKVTTDYIFRDSDLMQHTLHRHELPVLGKDHLIVNKVDEEIDIIYQDDNLLVVYKPASLPVHACGQFHNNSLTSILLNVHKLTGLKVIHRLDR